MKIKRFISLVFTAIFMFSFVTYAGASAEGESDSEDSTVLYQSDFDSGSYDDWYSFGNQSTLELDSVHSYDGKYSLLAKDRTAQWSGPAMNVTKYLTGGESINFEARVTGANYANENAQFLMTLKMTDAFGTDIYINIDEGRNERNIWKKLKGDVTVPGNIVDAMLYFESDDISLDFCIDHVVISKSGNAVPVIEPEKAPNEPEYVFDFEKNLEGWISRGDMSIGINTQFAYKGKNSLYASNRTLSWNGPAVRLDRIVPGKNYTYSAYVYYNGKEYEPEHVYELSIQYILNGEEKYDTIAAKLLQKGTWSNITGTYAIPEEATNVYLYVKTEYVEERTENINDLMSFYIDNITVIDISIITKRELKKTLTKIFAGIGVLCVIGAVSVLIVLRSRKTKDALRTASLDFMTKAYNRNAFETEVAEFTKEPDKLRKLFITSCDVNFLKYINDNYGHESGDRAIIRCASVLLRSVSKKGKVYRTGGDEFICITPENPEKKIRAEFTLESNKYEGYPFSIALGTVIFESSDPNEKPDIEKLIAESDQAMYKDKQQVKAEFSQFSGMSIPSVRSAVKPVTEEKSPAEPENTEREKTE